MNNFFFLLVFVLALIHQSTVSAQRIDSNGTLGAGPKGSPKEITSNISSSKSNSIGGDLSKQIDAAQQPKSTTSPSKSTTSPSQSTSTTSQSKSTTSSSQSKSTTSYSQSTTSTASPSKSTTSTTSPSKSTTTSPSTTSTNSGYSPPSSNSQNSKDCNISAACQEATRSASKAGGHLK